MDRPVEVLMVKMPSCETVPYADERTLGEIWSISSSDSEASPDTTVPTPDSGDCNSISWVWTQNIEHIAYMWLKHSNRAQFMPNTVHTINGLSAIVTGLFVPVFSYHTMLKSM